MAATAAVTLVLAVVAAFVAAVVAAVVAVPAVVVTVIVAVAVSAVAVVTKKKETKRINWQLRLLPQPLCSKLSQLVLPLCCQCHWMTLEPTLS